MEKEIKDALNFVIGAATTVKSETEKLVTNLEAEFKKLADKGSLENSEVAMNVRKYSDEAFKEVEKVLKEATSKFEEAKTQVKGFTDKKV
jgi:flavorubredoxin